VQVDVEPSGGARIEGLRVQAGDRVRVGDTLAALTTPTRAADVAQRAARVAQAEAALRELERGPRSAEVARAAAELRGAAAEAERTGRELRRYTALLAAGAVSQQQLDAARAAAAGAAARRDQARESLRLLSEGTRPERVAAARAEVEAARAGAAAARATASDLVLLAPVSGVVLGRLAEPGELLAAGEPALTVGATREPYVTVYVSERVLPAVRVGGRAVGRLAAMPGRVFRGRVTAINASAEFTPRVALTEEERADLLFGVRVDFDDSTETLKPGLPVTVRLEVPTAPMATTTAAAAGTPLAARGPR
jgi:HlyD family secretion protein